MDTKEFEEYINEDFTDIEIEELSSNDAEKEISKCTTEDLPDEFRGSVWNVVDIDGEVLLTWYIGPEGALSYEGTELSSEQWESYLNKIRHAE